MRFAEYELRERERRLIGPDGPVELSNRSFDILTLLLARPHETVDKSAIFDAVWPGIVVGENALQVHVSSLRKLLGSKLIATVHGRGYKYVGPLPQAEPQAGARPARLLGNAASYRGDCIGRDSEIAGISRLLEGGRLVSIVGPGGVGKTTLAVELAARLTAEKAGGSWVVDLAPIGDPAHVVTAVVSALGLQPSTTIPAAELLARHIQNEDALVVLDNCEHVIEAAAEVVQSILQRGPRMRIIATSQVPLGLGQEHVFKLQPFAAGDPDEAGGLAPSAAFFRHCYEALGEKVDEGEWSVVASLCQNLSGVALALKMAAARAATLGIPEVARQIQGELGSLSAPWPTSLPRHRSLSAALTWSHGLLSELERRVFRALGVFSGGFTLDAAVAVGGDQESVFELLRKSLLVREPDSSARYRLLETSRQFAVEQLRGHGEEDEARGRHARYIIGLLAGSHQDWERMTDVEWLRNYTRELENVRASAVWLMEGRRWTAYAELCAVAWRLWLEAGYAEEGLAHCERALANGDFQGRAELDARLRLGTTELCRATAHDSLGVAIIAPAVEHFRATGDRLGLAHALSMTILVSHVKGNSENAHAAARELAELIESIGESKLHGSLLASLGLDLIDAGDAEAGLSRGKAGIALLWAKGCERSALRVGLFIAEMIFAHGHMSEAVALAQNLVQRGRQPRFRIERSILLGNLAIYHIALREFDAARELVLEAAEFLTQDAKFWHIGLVQSIAAIEAETGDSRLAARLLGHVDKFYADAVDGRHRNEEIQCASIVDRLKTKMPAADLERALAEGARLSPFEADFLAGLPVVDRGGAPASVA